MQVESDDKENVTRALTEVVVALAKIGIEVAVDYLFGESDEAQKTGCGDVDDDDGQSSDGYQDNEEES